MQQPATATAAGDRLSTCVLVLGMHRSGTSALTRVLNLLGVALGEHLMQAAQDNNETGFWEHQGVVDVHDTLLAAFGMRWHDPRRLPDGWTGTPAADAARTAIRGIIAEEFDGRPLWGVKDPRMCRLLPLWRPLLNELGIRPVVVHMVRQPLEIARSLERRDDLPRGQGLLLWLRHQIEAVRASQGLGQAWVGYDPLIADWRSAIAPVAGQLGADLATGSAEVAATIDGFLVPALRHHILDGAALAHDPDLAAWVGSLYLEVQKVTAGESSSLLATAERIESELDRAAVYFDQAFERASAIEIALNTQIAERDGRIVERDSRIAERDTRIAERDGRLAERDSRVAERDSRIAELDAKIALHDAQLAEREAIADTHREALGERDREIAAWRQREAEVRANLEALTRSTSWRVTRPLRWIRRGLGLVAGCLRIGSHNMRPVHLHGLLTIDANTYRSVDSGAWMVLTSHRHRLPSGYVEVSYHFSAARTAMPSLLASAGHNLTEADRLRLPPIRDGIQHTLVRLPDNVQMLRLDPVQWADTFTLTNIRIREIGATTMAMRMVSRIVQDMLAEPGQSATVLREMVTDYRRGGFTVLRHRFLPIGDSGSSDYATWCRLFDTLTDRDRNAIRRHIETLERRPTISLVMPTYNTTPAILNAAVESVFAQLYPFWELCIADDASTDPATRAALRALAARDERVKVTFREYNGHISAASNTALAMTTGDYVALLDHDDTLPEHALYRVVCELNDHPDATIIYSDEDKIDESGHRYQPYFKPDFNPDLFLAQNMISHLGVYRRDLIEASGGFREGFEGSQDHDLALRAVERSRPDQIRHISSILYHWRAVEGSVATATSAKPYAGEAARRAIQEHLARQGTAAEVVEDATGGGHRVLFPMPEPQPLVSVIVPTRDCLHMLRKCIDGLIGKTDYQNWELLVVDNGSEQQETLDWLAELVVREPRARVIRDDSPFNFSRLNNRAAAEARGELLLLLNNDVEPIGEDWLSQMVRHVTRPQVGVVGAKLLYADDTIQHAGVMMGLGGVAGHVHRGLASDDPGYFGRAAATQDMTAVTAACLIIRKSVYEAVGGLDEQSLAVAFNDIDLCLKVREFGHRVLWTPNATLYHYESTSRGNDTDPDKIERFKREIAYMSDRWGDVINRDPNYNPNLATDLHTPGLAFPPREVRPWQGF